MIHSDSLSGVRGEERCIKRDVADVATGDVESRELHRIQIFGWRSWRKDAPPYFGSLTCVRKWKLHDEPQAAHEGFVQCALHIRGQNRQPPVSLHTLQQVTHFNVCVTIVTVLDLAPF